ncbi:SOS response-associated peptidase family protein [Metallibacterium scheffleri]
MSGRYSLAMISPEAPRDRPGGSSACGSRWPGFSAITSRLASKCQWRASNRAYPSCGTCGGGLTRPWTKDKKVTYLTINARVEGLTANHPFRHAWRHEQRRLVLALG